MTDGTSSATKDSTIEARATVHLQRLSAGATARVDPEDPYVAELLEHGFLVPVGREATLSDGS